MSLDINGYPTQDGLEAIKNYDLIHGSIDGFLDLIKDNWHYGDAGFKVDGTDSKHLELHTLGWSGNEDTFAAVMSNVLARALYWQRSDRGGHHYFLFDRKW